MILHLKMRDFEAQAVGSSSNTVLTPAGWSFRPSQLTHHHNVIYRLVVPAIATYTPSQCDLQVGRSGHRNLHKRQRCVVHGRLHLLVTPLEHLLYSAK